MGVSVSCFTGTRDDPYAPPEHPAKGAPGRLPEGRPPPWHCSAAGSPDGKNHGEMAMETMD